MTAPPRTSAPQHPIGRIPVLDVAPCVDHGARPAKSVVGEEFTVTATVLREGHDAVNASLVLTDPDGVEHVQVMECTNPGLNAWSAVVAADRTGWWSYRVEGWSDPYGTWVHDATIKVQADGSSRASRTAWFALANAWTKATLAAWPERIRPTSSSTTVSAATTESISAPGAVVTPSATASTAAGVGCSRVARHMAS